VAVVTPSAFTISSSSSVDSAHVMHEAINSLKYQYASRLRCNLSVLLLVRCLMYIRQASTDKGDGDHRLEFVLAHHANNHNNHNNNITTIVRDHTLII
jgi:hypothetical protein